MSTKLTRLALFLLAAGAVACAKDETDKKQELTQREKDSVLAGSTIPGAKAVKKAMTTADSVTARQARMDSTERAERTP